ncbi:TonB family protein [Parabacteroides sp. CH2-D42-20]|uniref:M56 family metallopeptidase n=2 Tax=Bacteroidales TaxID=171549 RepID=UPI000EF6F3AC|nr:M56 family metallopeptidase [Parabacteroides sp. CH2-D42-20]RLT68237.1 TonB family protein [Parabacteroides sp. CH2-D42-20]
MAGIFLAYSLLASTLLIVVWVVYKCVLANIGCFRFNRILLLSSITLAFVSPIFILNPFWLADIMENNIEIAFNPVEVAYIANTLSEQITPIWDYIVTLYLIGVIVMTIYFLVSLVRLTLFILKGEHIKQDDCRIILHRHNSVAPFAWCGYIMMPRRDWYEFGQMIVCHEKAHIECRHWIDLLFMQAAIIITWYCPAIWLLRNELHTLHEYEADSRVLASGIKREEYQIFLIKKTVGARFATLSNCLNHSSLKKRITMMLSSKPTGKARVRAFVMVPAMALALIGLATPAVSAVINEVSAATPVEDLRYKISEKSDSTIRVTERNSDVEVTEKADAADAVPFIKTETAPNFPGGKDKLTEFVNKNISFPESTYVNGILDMDAVVQLTIAKDGVVKDARIVKSSGQVLDAEALRVARMLPKFHPGLNGGLPAESSYTLAFNYSVNKQQ